MCYIIIALIYKQTFLLPTHKQGSYSTIIVQVKSFHNILTLQYRHANINVVYCIVFHNFRFKLFLYINLTTVFKGIFKSVQGSRGSIKSNSLKSINLFHFQNMYLIQSFKYNTNVSIAYKCKFLGKRNYHVVLFCVVLI